MNPLESARLVFRQHQLADLEAYCAMEADPQVRRYVGGAPRSREAAERRFRDGCLKPSASPLSVRATILKSGGCYIGRCGIYPHFRASGPVDGEAAISFYLARAYWGRGLATEAGRVFVAYGFDQLRLRRIVAAADAENARSIRVLEKLGFRLAYTEGGARLLHHFELCAREVHAGPR